MKEVISFIFTLLISIFVFGCTSSGPKPSLSTPGFLIDDHTHYRATDEWENKFLKIYGKYNAMACVLVDMKELERGIKFAKDNPDRVIPYAAIEIDGPTVLDDIQKAYNMGFKGLGEIFATGQWNYDDPKYDPIWALAEKLGMPIAPHTGILSIGVMSRMRPGYLGTIAYKFPKLIIHAAHFGNPWYDEAAEVARRRPNLYFDITGSSLFKKDNDPTYWKEFLWWTPYLGTPHMPKDAVPAFQKLVFGTDEEPSGLETNLIRFNKMLDACNVSTETREYCFYKTMAEIHKIDYNKYLPKK